VAAAEERVDALYGLPLSEFTRSRDALAKELRKEGKREEADRVKSLRKPSAAAWVVNQLARTQRRDAKRLLDAGDALRDAYEKLSAGKGDATGVRRASEEQRQTAAALLELAPGLLDREGQAPSQATLDRVGETLHAVALDDDARREFEAGRLTRERRASGLPLMGVPAPAKSAPARRKKPARDDGAAERRARAKQALEEAKQEQRARSRDVTEAERELESARREAERVQSRLEQATTALEQAQAAEAEAEKRVADAESGVQAQRR
jgi:vacuolar-type H+-ATPase subunit I/STV1